MAGLKGTNGVLRRLNKVIKKQRLATKAGLMEASLVIKADSIKMTPIDWGNLRASGFVMVTNLPTNTQGSGSFKGEGKNELASGFQQAQGEGKSIVGSSEYFLIGIIAYSASYATWVHEMPANYNFNQGENKFLEKSLKNNSKRVLKILTKHAKV